MTKILILIFLLFPLNLVAEAKYAVPVKYAYKKSIKFPDFSINYIGTRSERTISDKNEESIVTHSDFEIVNDSEKSFCYCAWQERKLCSSVFEVSEKCFSLNLVKSEDKLIIRQIDSNVCSGKQAD